MVTHTGEIATLAAYYAVLGLLAVYGAHRVFMVRLYDRHRERPPQPAGPLDPLPRVTVQLPVYNEVYVVERLVEAAAALDHPQELLEIQILDDSTDATREIAGAAAGRLRERGFDAVHLVRPRRDGFKAGALQAGMEVAKGELFLILDADFVPRPELLREALPHFADASVGMVQARWGHLNRDHSLLTRVQAVLLDGHFVVEHTARHRSGRFFNFNGTAGIWRRACLVEAGGWQSDTLTEDLDVSYRAQLAGWRFVYLKDLVAPGELPVDINGFKSQQHRWAKGSIQTAVKLLPAVLRSRLPWRTKLEAAFHLTANVSYVLGLLLALLLVPAIVIRERIGWQRLMLFDVPLFAAGTLSYLAFYAFSQRELGRGWRQTARVLPGLLGLGIGLAVNNVRAVVEALFGGRLEFTRTPKYRIEGPTDAWHHKIYRAPRNGSIAGEILLAVYFFGAIVFSAVEGYWAGIPFLVLFFGGFAWTAALSAASWRLGRGGAAEEPAPARAAGSSR